ncbi:MAG: sigma-70 family RNA polymerase sigma factor [Nocardioides sp.]|nr:sigma-70 family RNA polymerase sigma factor [Nocardioides sp.]
MVSNTLQAIEGPGDAELISAVRGGDIHAYGQLFERHVDSARRLARQLVSPGDVDDLVSDAFAKVLVVLQRGGGPDIAFRAYLLTAVRRLRVDRFRAAAKVQVTDDMEAFHPGVPFRDTAVEGFENAAAARAFASLPERWQAVLWHTEVEGQKPADVAVLLGMTPNSVSALAYRAREGLRQAFLTQHASELDDDTCRWTHEHLGAYVRGGLSRRDTGKVEDHVKECRTCAAIYLELTEVNSNLSGVLAPLLLGGFAAAYVASGTTSAGVGAGIGVLAGRVRDLVLSNAPVAAAAGVATTALITGAVFVAVQNNDNSQLSSPEMPLGPLATSSSRTPGPTGTLDAGTGFARSPGALGSETAGPGDAPDGTVIDLPTGDPSTDPSVGTGDPTDDGSDDPTAGPSDEPSDKPSDKPTKTPTNSPTTAPTTTAPTSDPTVGPTLGPTVGPTLGPTLDPTIGPTENPTTGPTDDPTGNPTDDPTEEPTEEPTVDPTNLPPSLAVSATRSCFVIFCEIDVAVIGVPTNVEGVLNARVNRLAGLVQLKTDDDRCARVEEEDGVDRLADGSIQNIRCTVSPNPDIYTFTALHVPGSTLTFRVTVGDGQATDTVTFD